MEKRAMRATLTSSCRSNGDAPCWISRASPETFEMYKGKLFFSERERRNLL